MLEEESLAALRVEIKEELSSNVHNDEVEQIKLLNSIGIFGKISTFSPY